MLRPQALLPDAQCALVERLGLHILALRLVQFRQVVERKGHIGMLRPQALFPDAQRAPEIPLRLLIGTDHAQVLTKGCIEVRRHDIPTFAGTSGHGTQMFLQAQQRRGIALCWLLGTSVRKTRRFLRTDAPSSQHK